MTNGLTTLDYSAIAIYLALMAGIGGVLGLYVKNVKEYFAGGNAVPWHLGAISNYMTMMSTFVFVAHAGVAYKDGLVALVILWSAVPAALFGTAFLASRWRRAGLMTPVEYLEQRYSASVRQITSWGGVVFRLLDNMVRLYALGVFISGTLGCSLNKAIAVSGGIVIVYTMIGGLWAVVVTDAVQCAILLMITCVMVPLALSAVGGLTALMAAVPEHFTWMNGAKGSYGFLFVYFAMVLIKYNGNWAFIQRFYCTQNERAAQKMGLLSAALFFICPVIFLLPAIAAAVLVPDLANPEQAYVSVCKRLLPSGAMGLMIAAMLSATMSTLSAEYNVTAGVLTRDIYRRLLRPQAENREQMLVARMSTVALGILIICGATQVQRFGGAFEVNKTLMGLIGVPLVVPLVFGVLWRRPKPWGAVASILMGVAAGFLFKNIPRLNWEAATFCQMLVCLSVLALSAPGESRSAAYRQRVTAFFNRLSVPVRESEDDDAASARGHRSIMILFAIALGLSGLLFVGISLFNVALPSGQYTLTAGIVCCLIAAALGWNLMRCLTHQQRARAFEKGVE
jgi:SSS family transporter